MDLFKAPCLPSWRLGNRPYIVLELKLDLEWAFTIWVGSVWVNWVNLHSLWAQIDSHEFRQMRVGRIDPPWMKDGDIWPVLKKGANMGRAPTMDLTCEPNPFWSDLFATPNCMTGLRANWLKQICMFDKYLYWNQILIYERETISVHLMLYPYLILFSYMGSDQLKIKEMGGKVGGLWFRFLLISKTQPWGNVSLMII